MGISKINHNHGSAFSSIYLNGEKSFAVGYIDSGSVFDGILN